MTISAINNNIFIGNTVLADIRNKGRQKSNKIRKKPPTNNSMNSVLV